MKKKIPVGYEDIKELVNKGFYYVDKTMMIKELLIVRGKSVYSHVRGDLEKL